MTRDAALREKLWPTEAVFELADRFVPPSEEDAERLRRIRTGITVAWMGIVFCALSVVLYAAYGSPISAGAIAVILVGLIAAAPAIRRGVSVGTVANVATGITWAVTFVVVWRTGGLSSPAVVWAFFHPITMYIACGRRTAIIWSGLSALQIVIIFAAEHAGVNFASDLSTRASQSVQLGGYLIVILANVLVIGGNEVIRRAAEESRQEADRLIERQRILGDMHDGVGSQLLGLMIQVRAGSIDAERLLQGLGSCVDDLRLIVDSLDPVERPFEVSLAELRGRVEPRCAAAGIELRWTTDERDTPIPIDPEQALQVLRALQEVFSNALRHSATHRIDFAVRSPGAAAKTIEVEVRDYGRGFDPQAARPGARGLSSLHGRMLRLGGLLAIESADPGTRVTLCLPAAEA